MFPFLQTLKEACGSGKLTGDGIHKVVKLPLEDIQRMLQDLQVVGLTQCYKVQLLLHSTAYGGQHKLCIYKTNSQPLIGILMSLYKKH